MNQDNPFLSAADIAKRWSISIATIRRMISRGELDHIKLGRSVRVPISEVKAYEKMHRS